MRKSFAAFASAPARSNRSAAATSFQCAAHKSAVEPSSARAFTSARWLSSAADLLLVLVPGRLDQPEIAVCRGGTRHHQQHHQERAGHTALLYPSRMPFPLWLVSTTPSGEGEACGVYSMRREEFPTTKYVDLCFDKSFRLVGAQRMSVRVNRDSASAAFCRGRQNTLDLGLTGKRALVTSSTAGIRFATAQVLAPSTA